MSSLRLEKGTSLEPEQPMLYGTVGGPLAGRTLSSWGGVLPAWRWRRSFGKAGIETTVIDRHHFFQPLLYQVAAAALSATDVAEPIRKVLRGKDSVQVLFGEVSEVDLAHREVRLRGFAASITCAKSRASCTSRGTLSGRSCAAARQSLSTSGACSRSRGSDRGAGSGPAAGGEHGACEPGAADAHPGLRGAPGASATRAATTRSGATRQDGVAGRARRRRRCSCR